MRIICIHSEYYEYMSIKKPFNKERSSLAISFMSNNSLYIYILIKIYLHNIRLSVIIPTWKKES